VALVRRRQPRDPARRRARRGVVSARGRRGRSVLVRVRRLRSAPGRAVDRRGLPVLLLFAAAYGAALVALALLAAGSAPLALLAVAAGLAGATAPPLVASARKSWSTVVEEGLLRRAYALTSLIGDAALVAAPAVAGAIAVWSTSATLALCAACAIAAAAVLAQTRPAERDTAEPARPQPASPIRSRRFRAILAVSTALGLALGLVEVTVPALVSAGGERSLTGAVLAAFALGSVAGGLWFGRVPWKAAAEDRYLVAVGALALALVPLAFAHPIWLLALLLIVAGSAFGPATVSLFEALDVLAADSAIEAFTWVTTAEAAGTAAGAALAGYTLAAAAQWLPFTIAAASLAVPAAAVLAARRLGGGKAAARPEPDRV
jgi:predicted MFS family arabinose efflux permease